MIAEDREPDHRIAAAVGVSRRTIEYWKKRADVAARIQEVADKAAARMEAHYDRLEWLEERERCKMTLGSKSYPARVAALARLREMGGALIRRATCLRTGGKQAEDEVCEGQ